MNSVVHNKVKIMDEENLKFHSLSYSIICTFGIDLCSLRIHNSAEPNIIDFSFRSILRHNVIL